MTTKDATIHDLLASHWEQFINGGRVVSDNDERISILSPANGDLVGTISNGNDKDIDLAVSHAAKAFLNWSRLTAYEREKIIIRATAHVRRQAEVIGMLMAHEQGKPYTQCKSEILASCDTIDYYAAEGVRIEGYTNPTEKNSYRSWVIYQPVGVCGLITPWNYPVSLLSWKLGPALAAGCTTVVKPTEITPLSPTAFCMALTEGGIPAGVINVVNGKSGAGQALVRHPMVKKIAMTGSTQTGKHILEAAAPFLKKVSLELGGHAPAIVCADADLDNAAAVIAYKGFRNNGQSCSSVNRVYVHRSVHENFIAKLKGICMSLTLGDPVLQPEADLGPMISRGALSRVKHHVSDALSKGAKLVTGGAEPTGQIFAKGCYYLPTIMDQVPDDALMMVEETFGAVVPIQEFDDIEGVIQKANKSNFGLVSYLFTKDFKTTVAISEALEAGTVAVNCGAVNTNYAPYSGWKDSGFGMELSRNAIYEYLLTKHIKVEML